MPDQTIHTMDVSPAERAVILAMRQDNRTGRAIFNYALKFDSYQHIDTTRPPYRQADKLSQ